MASLQPFAALRKIESDPKEGPIRIFQINQKYTQDSETGKLYPRAAPDKKPEGIARSFPFFWYNQRNIQSRRQHTTSHSLKTTNCTIFYQFKDQLRTYRDENCVSQFLMASTALWFVSKLFQVAKIQRPLRPNENDEISPPSTAFGDVRHPFDAGERYGLRKKLLKYRNPDRITQTTLTSSITRIPHSKGP